MNPGVSKKVPLPLIIEWYLPAGFSTPIALEKVWSCLVIEMVQWLMNVDWLSTSFSVVRKKNYTDHTTKD
jgi:hypothetical protein